MNKVCLYSILTIKLINIKYKIMYTIFCKAFLINIRNWVPGQNLRD